MTTKELIAMLRELAPSGETKTPVMVNCYVNFSEDAEYLMHFEEPSICIDNCFAGILRKEGGAR